ncbi:glycosyltransferase family 39 protein [Leifsonia poae]|uniref:glycosyltransferase family 39 protein n=1 Tax=Leifsonia poae TaxID=110933 RepID=UPI001CBADD2F|nr:glycosyltransferase family 39 protein [Leifsonia poae]
MILVDARTQSEARPTLRDALSERWLVAAALGILATAISAAGSWIPSLWGDEVASLLSAERPLPSLFQMLGHVDAVHGTYYLGLHVWIHFFGISPFALRFPSAIAVGLATMATVALAWRLTDRRLAVIAGVVCVMLPRVTYMGEEARSYAFSAAFAAWLTLVLIEILRRERPRRIWWAAYGALLAVGTYVFLYLVLFVVVHLVILLVSRANRALFARWAITVGLAAVACAPLGIAAFLERGQISYLSNTDQLSFTTLFSSLWFGAWPFAIAAWALIAVAVVSEWRWRKRSVTPGDRRVPSLVVVAGLWLVLPSGILIAAHAATPDFTARYVSFCAPAAALLIAVGLQRTARLARWLPIAAGIVLLGLVLPVFVAQRTPYAKNGSDWAEVSATIGAEARPGDAVVFDETAKPSHRPRLAMHAYPAGFAGLDDVALKTPFTSSSTWYDRAYTVPQTASLGRFTGVSRVWLIEDASSGTPDTYGLASLEALGFSPAGAAVRTHSSQILQLQR